MHKKSVEDRRVAIRSRIVSPRRRTRLFAARRQKIVRRLGLDRIHVAKRELIGGQTARIGWSWM